MSRRLLSAVLAFTLAFIWSVPAWALRNLEIEQQQGAGLEDLRARLQEKPASRTATPAPAVAKVQAGLEQLEDWQTGQVRDSFQQIIARDLLADVRWPEGMTVDEQKALIDGAIKTMTAITIQEKGESILKSVAELRAYLLKRFGVRTIVMGGGRSRGYSKDPFDSKHLFKADGANSVVKQALEAGRINSPLVQKEVQDVVMLSYNMLYHILRDRRIEPADRKNLGQAMEDVLGKVMTDMQVSIPVQGDVQRIVLEVLRGNLRSTASGYRGDLRWTLNELDRQLRNVPGLSGSDQANSIREGVVDDVGFYLSMELLKAPDAIDPRKQADVIGDNVIVLLTPIRGPGGTYYEALEELERRGLLDQTKFALPVYGDQALAVMDKFPSTYLIGYLTALNQLSWPYKEKPEEPGDWKSRFPEDELLEDQELGHLPVVIWGVKSPLDKVEGRGQALTAHTPFGEVPAENREWKDPTFTAEMKAQRERLLEKSRLDKDKSTKTGQPYRPSHFMNGSVFLFDNRWAFETFRDEVMTHPQAYPQGYSHSRAGANVVEFWYTDLIGLGHKATVKQWELDPRLVPRTKMFAIGEVSPSGVGDRKAAAEFQKEYQAMLHRLIEGLGVYVHPDAQVAISSPHGNLDLRRDLAFIFGKPGQRQGIKLFGRVRIDQGAVVQEGVVLDGRVTPVEIRVGLEEIPTVLEPGAQVINSTVAGSWIAGIVRDSELEGAVVARGETVEGLTRQSRLDRMAQIVEDPQTYVPGVARLSERTPASRDGLIAHMRQEIVTMYEDKIEGREKRKEAIAALDRLLAHPASRQLTNEELYRYAFIQMQQAAKGADPFAAEKGERSPEREAVREFAEGLLAEARRVNVEIKAEEWAQGWGAVSSTLEHLTRMATLANFLDRQSVEVRQVFSQPDFFKKFAQNLKQAVRDEEQLGIYGLKEWQDLVLGSSFKLVPGTFLYLVDNVEEAEVDAALWLLLARLGHTVVIGAKSGPARGDATVEDVRKIIDRHAALRREEGEGRIQLIGTGSQTYGTSMDHASDALHRALTDPHLRAVVMKGEGNLYTTVTRNALKVPVVTMLLSKGLDAAMVTGVSDPQRRKAVPVIAVVPAGRQIIDPVPDKPGQFQGTLKELVREERDLDKFARESENYKALVRILGTEAKALEAISAQMRRDHLTFRQVVLGRLHDMSLQSFLSHDPVHFVKRQRELERAELISFGGGSAGIVNQEALGQDEELRNLKAVAVTNGSDNGVESRDQRLFDAMLPHFGFTFKVGDITAAFKGAFSPEVQQGLLEPDHRTIWANPDFWARVQQEEAQAIGPTFTERMEYFLRKFASDQKNLAQAPDFVRLAVELMNLAAVADREFVGSNPSSPIVHSVDLASVRHVIFNALLVAVDAYSRERKTIDPDRFHVGLYLLQKAFGLSPRLLPNSLDPQELYATLVDSNGQLLWESTDTFTLPRKPGDPDNHTVKDGGQTAISLSPDRVKPGGIARYGEFGFINPAEARKGRKVPGTVRADQEVLRTIEKAEEGALLVYGPSSFVVSLSPIPWSQEIMDAIDSRPDLAKVMMLNLTRNGETLGWTIGDYIHFWEEKVTGLPFERTVDYLVIHAEEPDQRAQEEAQKLAQAVGSSAHPNYEGVIEMFDPQTLKALPQAQTAQAAIDRLRKAQVQEPERQLLLALVLADFGEGLGTFKSRGGVPAPSEAELADLTRRGVTVIRSPMMTLTGEQYVGGKGRVKVIGAYHDRKKLGQVYRIIRQENRHRLDQQRLHPELAIEQGGLLDVSPQKVGLEEESIWPEATPLTFANVEPILIFQAEGGFGDIAYLIKLVDSFNARRVNPIVAVVGPKEKQQAAMAKLSQMSQDIPVQYSLWFEEDGHLVDSAGQPVQGNRSRRPVLIQHFSLVNPDWARDTAERLVPALIGPLYEPWLRNRFLLIGYNAPGNVFGGYLKQGQGEFLNLYMSPSRGEAEYAPDEPSALYTGSLFDRQLRGMVEVAQATSRSDWRTDAVSRLGLARDLAQAALSKPVWASLYLSQGGSERQLDALMQALRNSYGKAAIFTYLGKNPRLWYYPDDFWTDHAQLAGHLKTDPTVSFVDLTGTFGSQEREGAALLVVNLPVGAMGSYRSALRASDVAMVSGYNSQMDAMAMAANKVGPQVIFTFPVFRWAEQKNLSRALSSIDGADPTLQETAAFDHLRDPHVSPAELEATVEFLTRLFQAPAKQSRFQSHIGQLVTLALQGSGDSTDGNLGNKIIHLLVQADQGTLDPEAITGSHHSVETIELYQAKAKEDFAAGREPKRSYSGLEEGFRAELEAKMRANDTLSVSELTTWAESHGVAQEKLFEAMREIGPAQRETDERFWRSFLQVLTPDGAPTDTLKTFRAIHADGDWHPVASVQYFTPDGKLFLQVLSNGKRDLSAGGHQEPGQSIIETIQAESQEEILFSPDPQGLHEVHNPLSSSGGVFRKVGRRDNPGPAGYDDQGVYRYRPSGFYNVNNSEIDRFFIHRLTAAKLASIEGAFSARQGQPTPWQGVGYVIGTVEEFTADAALHPERYASGFQQYFGNPAIRAHILAEIGKIPVGLEETEERKFLADWEQLKTVMESWPTSPATWQRLLIELIDNKIPIWWFQQMRQFIQINPALVTPDLLTALSETVTTKKLDRYRRHGIQWLVNSLASEQFFAPPLGEIQDRYRPMAEDVQKRVAESDDAENRRYVRSVLAKKGIELVELEPLARQGANKTSYRAVLRGGPYTTPSGFRVVKVMYASAGTEGSSLFGSFSDFSDEEASAALYKWQEIQKKAGKWIARLDDWGTVRLPWVEYRMEPNARTSYSLPVTVYVTIQEWVPGLDLQAVLDQDLRHSKHAVQAAQEAFRGLWKAARGVGVPNPKPADVMVWLDEQGPWQAKVVDLDRLELMNRAVLQERLSGQRFAGRRVGLEEALSSVVTRLQDPLEQRAREGEPARLILSDLDKTAAAKPDAPVAGTSQGEIRSNVEAGATYGLLTTRDSVSATQRLGPETILAGLPPEAADRLRVYGRFGSAVLQDLVAQRSQGHYFSMDRLEQAIVDTARTIPAFGEDPSGPFQGLSVGDSLVPELDSKVIGRNTDMTVMNRGHFGLYVLNAPETEQVFAIITVYGVRNADPNPIREQAFDPRPQIVAALRQHFPGAEVTSTGFGSINLSWINKADLIEHLVSVSRVPQAQVAFLDDEGKTDGTGRKGLELVAGMGGKAVLVGEPDPTLPAEVIQSTRRSAEAHDRFLRINAARLLGEPVRAASDAELDAVLTGLQSQEPNALNALALIRQHYPDDRTVLEQKAAQLGVPLPAAGAGLEQAVPIPRVVAPAPALLPGDSAREILDLGGIDRSAGELAGGRYVERQDVREALATNGGWLPLDADLAAQMTGLRKVGGGLLVAEDAPPLDSGLEIIADSDLSNNEAQRRFVWLSAGPNSGAILKNLPLLKVRRGNEVIFEREEGLLPESILQRMTQVLGSPLLARALIGSQEEVRALPAAAFQVLAIQEGLPAVVDLVIFRLEDKETNRVFNLIVWV